MSWNITQEDKVFYAHMIMTYWRQVHLQGMINDLVKQADFPVGDKLNGEINHLEEKNPTAIARVISSAENFLSAVRKSRARSS